MDRSLFLTESYEVLVICSGHTELLLWLPSFGSISLLFCLSVSQSRRPTSERPSLLNGGIITKDFHFRPSKSGGRLMGPQDSVGPDARPRRVRGVGREDKDPGQPWWHVHPVQRHRHDTGRNGPRTSGSEEKETLVAPSPTQKRPGVKEISYSTPTFSSYTLQRRVQTSRLCVLCEPLVTKGKEEETLSFFPVSFLWKKRVVKTYCHCLET